MDPPTQEALLRVMATSRGRAQLAALDAQTQGVHSPMPQDRGWQPHVPPISLDLRLPNSALNQEVFRNEKTMRDRYGFNLKLSNELPLHHYWPDHRNGACKARRYPKPFEMPKVSVIIIFYNEPCSTLLRNVVGVLNQSPPSLLGEIVLVDDHSTLEELSVLPEHLERLAAVLPPRKVRLVRRESHDGIVGARVQGAETANYPIIVFLDSHAEVCTGWLEPLIARIHEDPTRVVVPQIRPIDINNLELLGGDSGVAWPPSRGLFNWRLTYTIVQADIELDLLEHDVAKEASAVRSPVMPGGLFAMDRDFFFKLGAYDREIKYYGAEHVELSFRVWRCGGSLETVPCSNVGHIYREFNRFGQQQDPLLRGVNIGHFLDRNDARVAEVWLDNYRALFYGFRRLNPLSMDLGNLSERKSIRDGLQCKSFAWYLKEICRNVYVPDMAPITRSLGSPDKGRCLTSTGGCESSLAHDPCRGFDGRQEWVFTSTGYLQRAIYDDYCLLCLRVNMMSQIPCNEAPSWKLSQGGEIHTAIDASKCLERTPSGQLTYRGCTGAASQHWVFKDGDSPDGGTLSGPDYDQCIDNMQKEDGAPGLYGCHGGRTQLWERTWDKKLRSKFNQGGVGVCLGFRPSVGLYECALDDTTFGWDLDTGQLRPNMSRTHCLERLADGAVDLRLCTGVSSGEAQAWVFG